jgi:hypothetical protein
MQESIVHHSSVLLLFVDETLFYLKQASDTPIQDLNTHSSSGFEPGQGWK